MYSEQDSFSYPGGLPYDEGQAVPLPRSLADRVSSASTDVPPSPATAFVDDIDRPLDELIEERAPRRSNNGRGRGMRSDGESEYVPQPRGERRERSPPTQKLYLLSEVDAVIHHKMASDLLDGADLATTVDPSTLPQPPAHDALVRANALYFEGQPLTELPTDKVFSYISSFSTSLPLGVEWISDERLVVVFPSKLSAASALNALLVDPSSPAVLADLSVSTPSETWSTFDQELPTVEAHAVPTHLWPVTLRPVSTRLRMDADEGGAPDPSDGGVMKTRLGIRWARSNDKKLGRKSTSSDFYRKYGTTAGKPKVDPALFQEDILSSSFAIDRNSSNRNASSVGQWATRDRSASPVGRDPRTLARPMRRSASPNNGGGSHQGARGRGMRSDQLADLDADLDGLSRGERGERGERREAYGRRQGERGAPREGVAGRGNRRTEPRPRRDADDLDRELEQFLAQRTE